jgi:hypothetical protein
VLADNIIFNVRSASTRVFHHKPHDPARAWLIAGRCLWESLKVATQLHSHRVADAGAKTTPPFTLFSERILVPLQAGLGGDPKAATGTSS